MSADGSGPFNNKHQVLALPEVRAILDHGDLRGGNLGLLSRALARAGVELGGYEGDILGWVANYEPQMVAVIAGWIDRAHQAGKNGSGRLAEVRANLVIVSDIAYRLDVAVSTVASWPERYDDWPEPFVLGAQQRPGSHGRQAVYWWPDILAFLARHDLPGGHPGRKRTQP